ncbi:MAG: hypothetical protein M3444_08930 [Acidobacteriota bacterium]|nr:hypothetical protein [Acidobacteriota bacterium]
MHAVQRPMKRMRPSIYLPAAFLLLGVLLLPAAARAQWTTSNSNTTTPNNVGISAGTTAPNGNLDVWAAAPKIWIGKSSATNPATNAGPRIIFGDTTAVNPGLFTFVSNDAGTSNSIGAMQWANYSLAAQDKRVAGIAGVLSGAANSGAITFTTANAGALAERVRIDNAGNVGIGTASPSARLHLSAANGEALRFTTTGNSQGAGAQVGVSTYGDSTGGLIYLGPNFYLSSGGAISRYDTGSAAWGFGFDSRPSVDAARFFRVAADGTLTTPFMINSGGNVGLGTGVPTTRLTVTDGSAPYNAGATDLLQIKRGTANSATDGSGGTSILLANGSNAFRIKYGGTSDRLSFIDGGNVEVLSLANGGNVGIGTPTPAVKLDINASSNTAVAINATGAINASGAITGATVNATYQDVAEWVPSTQKLSAGTVVVLDASRVNYVLASTTSYDTAVAGVVSERPGVALGEGGEDKVLVATTGRVKVRVDATRAPIRVGDLLVTSDTEGVVMKSVPVEVGGRKMHAPGMIIGKALEPLEKGTGEILVLLSLQ